MEPFRFLLTICPFIGDDEPHVPIPAGSEYLPHARVPIELEKTIMTHLHVYNNITLGGIQESDAHLQIKQKTKSDLSDVTSVTSSSQNLINNSMHNLIFLRED